MKITIVGLGLIGGSFALALRELEPEKLWAVDIDRDALQLAERDGIIDKGYCDAEIPLKDSDIVILALYPNLSIKFLKDNINHFKPGAIITDVAGIKENMLREVASFIPENLDFIGGHPMAGKESKGLGCASKDIFKGANYIFTPTEKNKQENLLLLENIVKKIGCKNIVKIDSKKHDEIISYTSHLPHILAVALVNSDIMDVNTSSFVAGGFRDSTRVSNINSSLWTELFSSNRDNLINTIETFESNLKILKQALIENNHHAMKFELEKACKRRKELI
jgi:prephenate dehydrogenase